MSRSMILPLVLLTTASLSAQRQRPFGTFQPPSNTITTATDFGAVADLGGTVDFDAEATGTAVSRALLVRAGISGTGRPADRAFAASTVSFSRTAGIGDGVSVSEFGSVSNANPMQAASAGTSGDAPGSTSPSQGAHSIRVAYPNITSGNAAIVTIRWFGQSSAGASATADVDVDGDGTPEFSAVANGNRASATLQVTAGTHGVVIDITTDCSAAVAADGNARYLTSLSVHVIEGSLPTSCTFANFGTPCGADLNGTVSANLDLALDVTNGTADAIGLLLIGDQLATPMPLPIGTCDLVVDSGRRGFGVRFRTDATGAASIAMRTPRQALTASFQALILSADPSTMTRSLSASNGTELVCQ